MYSLPQCRSIRYEFQMLCWRGAQPTLLHAQMCVHYAERIVQTSVSDAGNWYPIQLNTRYSISDNQLLYHLMTLNEFTVM